MIKARVLRIFAVVCLLFALSAQALAGELEVHFVAVERNDAIFIRCGGETAFIDGGTRHFCQVAADYLHSQGVERLDYYIGTHGHKDHVGGAAILLTEFETGKVLLNYELAWACIMDDVKTQAERAALNAIKWQAVKPGDVFTIGDAVLTCVAPRSIAPKASWIYGVENENSLVFRLALGDISFLLTADATGDMLAQIAEDYPEGLRCTVFKNPHHNLSIRDELVDMLGAKYVVYSTSYTNQPLYDNLVKVRETGAQVFVTNRNHAGTTVFRTDGTQISVEYENKMGDWYLAVTELTLKVGQTRSIYKHMKPQGMLETLNWRSSDESVATVNAATGVIRAVAPGVCDAIATAFDGSERAIRVTVVSK